MVKKSTLSSQKSAHNKFVDIINNTPNFDAKFEALQKNPSITEFNTLFNRKIKSTSSLKGSMRRMKNGVEKFGTNIVKMAFKNNDIQNSSKVISNKIDIDNMKFSNPKFQKRVKSLIVKKKDKNGKVKVQTIKDAIIKANLISKGKVTGKHDYKVVVKSRTKKKVKLTKKKKGKKKKKKPKKYRTKNITIGSEELAASNEIYVED